MIEHVLLTRGGKTLNRKTNLSQNQAQGGA